MKANVLVVDDDMSILDGFKLLLLKNGYEVGTAKSVSDACALAERIKYDAIILDLVMPDMNGFDAMKTIRKNGKSAKAKVILLTGHPMKETFELAKMLGIEKCLAKPIEGKKLIEEIEDLVR